MELVPGTMVMPQLRLSRLLGQGAMGMIWCAERLDRGQHVAVKFMSAELMASDPTAIERFDREGEILKGIHHPHIVELLGHGRMRDGTPFIVLELMRGEPLVDELERSGVFELEETVRMIEQLASALDVLHGAGIIHRDVKAENIFIDRANETLTIKLFDFGLAKRPDDVAPSRHKPLTGIGTVVGTAEYMSPEQMVSSKDADFNADLWAIAVVAYVSLAGGLPFRGETIGAIFAQFASADFERPSQLREDIPVEVDRWFERAFKPEVYQRFPSGHEMASSLRAAMRRVAPSMKPTRPRSGAAPLSQIPAHLKQQAPLAAPPGPPPSAAPHLQGLSIVDAETKPSEGLPLWALIALAGGVIAGAAAALMWM